VSGRARACAAGALAVTILGATSSASAQSKQECVDAYTTAQVSRRENRLKDARDKLLVCSNAACPPTLRKDCVPWLAEVDAALPTLAVKPVDETGRVVEDATIAIDGRGVAREGDLAAARVDPGEHVIRVEAPGMKSAEERVSLAAGSPRREVVVHLGRAAAPAAAKSPVEAPPEASRPIPAATFVLAGVGVAGVATFAVLGAIGSGKKSHLDDLGCKPNCKPSDVDAIKTDYIAADVALGVGGAALVGALIVFLARPSATPAKPDDAAWSVAPRPGGASLVVRF
jgi:hypothetical protein